MSSTETEPDADTAAVCVPATTDTTAPPTISTMPATAIQVSASPNSSTP